MRSLALDDGELEALYDETVQLDLDCVVEVHDEADLERALALDPEVIGINNRSLHTFETDVGNTHELCSDISWRRSASISGLACVRFCGI